jgi:hypothetical protein
MDIKLEKEIIELNNAELNIGDSYIEIYEKLRTIQELKERALIGVWK